MAEHVRPAKKDKDELVHMSELPKPEEKGISRCEEGYRIRHFSVCVFVAMSGMDGAT
jgi:hypothetical protein